jgi:hypothetical protein
MLKADAKRLSWFLGLQRLWHFPKFFMAPPAYSRPGRGSMVADLETTGGGVRSSKRERATSTGSNGFRAPSPPYVHRATSPIDSSGRTTVLPFVRAAASAPTSKLPSWRAVSDSVLVTNRAPAIKRHTENRTAATHQPSTPQESIRLTNVSDAPGYRPEKVVPLAPIHAFLPEQRSGNFEHYPDPSPIATGVGEIAFGRPRFLPGEQPTLNQDSADQDQSPSSDRDGTAEGGQPQRGRPAVSTLHIDGSALGRWAVQYLERALGKPATGMTGVDPRATIPRSRVAPF